MQEIVNFVVGLWHSLPTWAAAPLLMVLGFCTATLARLLVRGFLALVRFDKASERTGFAKFLRKGAVTFTPSRLVAQLAYWLTLGIFLLQASRILDVGVVNAFEARLVETLPGLFAAIFVTVIGVLVVSFISKFINTISKNAALQNAELLGSIVKYLGIFVVLSIAIEQLNVAKNMLGSMILILFSGLSLAFALAFGLGCQDLAREIVQRIRASLKNRSRGINKTDLEG